MKVKDIIDIRNIQFKRCLDFPGDYKHAILAVKKMRPGLKSGEPMVVSFIESTNTRKYSYFLAIGRNLRIGNTVQSSPIITPMFTSIDNIEDVYVDSFNRYIKKNLRVDGVEDFFRMHAGKNPVILNDVFLVLDEYGRARIASTDGGLLHNTIDKDGNLKEVRTDNISIGNIDCSNLYDLLDMYEVKNLNDLNRAVVANLGLVFDNSRWHSIEESEAVKRLKKLKH